ncbi:MAG: DUF2958 domain-containing protein [Prevotellaceae bacterium]|jgi:hypothetical protein|nr:DUF2958 domain-containing protein [Prevotellaceae bacterium]
MKLVTKQLEREFKKYPLRSQDGKKEKAEVICKFFAPIGALTWYVLEAEKQENDFMFFGIVVNDCFEREYGYFTLSQLDEIELPMRLKIERDIYFCKCTVEDLGD